METLLTRITSIFNISKTLAITPAGIIGALGVVLLLWPPHPIDSYMKPSGSPPVGRFGKPTDALAQVADKSCVFSPARLKRAGETSDLEERTKKKFSVLDNYRELQRENQFALDDASAQISRCIAYDNNLSKQYDTDNSSLKAQIVAVTKERDSLQAQYLKYANDVNPLQFTLQAQTKKAQDELTALTNKEDALEKGQRGLQANIDLENVYLAQVKVLLSNPDPLRTRQNFDEVFNGISNHLLSFFVFSMLIGYVLDPGNAAIFGAIFDAGLMNIWNRVRKKRFKVVRVKEESGKFHCGDYTGNNEPRYLLYTTYAIGQNLITQAQVDSLKSQFYAQSQLAFGLIIPTIFLSFVLVFGVDIVVVSPPILFIVAGLLCLGAFLIGNDRLHRYYSELQLLIQSAYCVKLAAKVKQDAADAAALVAAAAAKKKADDAAAKDAITLDSVSKQILDLKAFVENWVKAPVSVNINTTTLPESKV
jgi:hypothetical protein